MPWCTLTLNPRDTDGSGISALLVNQEQICLKVSDCADLFTTKSGKVIFPLPETQRFYKIMAVNHPFTSIICHILSYAKLLFW